MRPSQLPTSSTSRIVEGSEQRKRTHYNDYAMAVTILQQGKKWDLRKGRWESGGRLGGLKLV